MVGALLIIASVTGQSFVLLLLGAAFLGLGTAANLQARFAAVDLAEPERRGRSLSTVVWAITIGAVAGPNLIQPGAAVGAALGLPPIAGPFVFSAVGLFLAAGLLFAGLRPDPLLLSRRLARQADASGEPASQPVGEPSDPVFVPSVHHPGRCWPWRQSWPPTASWWLSCP